MSTVRLSRLEVRSNGYDGPRIGFRVGVVGTRTATRSWYPEVARDAAYGRCVPPAPWWRFWTDGHDWRATYPRETRYRERCERCLLTRTLLWVSPRTWYYDATQKVS